jgi:tryptophan-rich sensory protein
MNPPAISVYALSSVGFLALGMGLGWVITGSECSDVWKNARTNSSPPSVVFGIAWTLIFSLLGATLVFLLRSHQALGRLGGGATLVLFALLLSWYGTASDPGSQQSKLTLGAGIWLSVIVLACVAAVVPVKDGAVNGDIIKSVCVFGSSLSVAWLNFALMLAFEKEERGMSDD